MITFILTEEDVARLFQVIYHGRRPQHVHTLLCQCGATADLRKSPSAWNGWRVLPTPRCPQCIEREAKSILEELYPLQAEERFLELLAQLDEQKEVMAGR